MDIAFAVGRPWQRPFGFAQLLDSMVRWRLAADDASRRSA